MILIGTSGSVSATVTLQGDLPADTVNYRVEVYNETQDTGPCDTTADGSSVTFGNSGSVTGDGYPNYDDDDDYNFSFNLSETSENVYIYFCEPAAGAGSKVKVVFNMTINNESTHIFDLGMVVGDANTHDDLVNDYVIVCDSLGGTELSSQDKKCDATDANYKQYYYIDESVVSSVYALFVNDTGSTCNINEDVSTGMYIDLSSSEGTVNHGVWTTFAPDTRLKGDAHTSLTNGLFFMYDSLNDKSIGLVNQSYNPTTINGTDDSDNDFVLYYDNPTSGTMWMVIDPTAGTNETLPTLTRGITGLDFVVQLNGTVPDEIDNVNITDSYGLIYYTDPDVNGYYTLYVPDNDSGNTYQGNITTQNLLFSTSALGLVYTDSTLDVKNVTVGAGAEDETVDLAKLWGYINSGFATADSTGQSCTMVEVWDDYTNPTTKNNTACFVYTSTPDNYIVYFTVNDTGGNLAFDFKFNNTRGYATWLNNYTDNSSYYGVSCGGVGTCNNNRIDPGDELQLNLNFTVTGDVPEDVSYVHIVDVASASIPIILTAPNSTGDYIIYVTPDLSTTDLTYVIETSLDSNVLQRNSTEGTSYTADDTFNAAKLNGTISSGFFNGTAIAAAVDVWDDLTNPVTRYNSESNVTNASTIDTYGVYFEVGSDGNTSRDIKFNSSANYITWLDDLTDNSSWWGIGTSPADEADNNIINAGEILTMELNYTLAGDVPTDIEYVSILDSNSNTSFAVAEPDSAGNYFLIMSGNWTATGEMYFTLNRSGFGDYCLYRNSTNGTAFTGNETFNAVKLKGAIHESMTSINRLNGVDVCDSYTQATPVCYNSASNITHEGGPGTNDSYEVYFEDPVTIDSVDIRFTNSDSEVSWVNNFTDAYGFGVYNYTSDGGTANNSAIEAGEMYDFNLTYVMTCGVPSDIVFVTLNDNNTGGPLYAAADPLSSGSYTLYVSGLWNASWNTSYRPDGGAWEARLEKPSGTNVLNWTIGYSVFTSDETFFCAGKINGTVPGTSGTTYLSGGTVNAYLSAGQYCGVGYNSTATITNTGGVTETYDIYLLNDTNYYLDFCDSAGDTEYETLLVKNVTAAEEGSLNLSMVTGKMCSDFVNDSEAIITVYDGFLTTEVGGQNRSDNNGTNITNNEAAGDYEVYFEQSGTKAILSPLTHESNRTSAGSATDVALKIMDNDSYVSWEIGVGSDITAGEIITADLVVNVSGTVPTDIIYVVVRNNSDDLAVGIPKAADGSYRIYTQDWGAVNLTLEKPAGSEVLVRNHANLDDYAFNANKVNGTLHADLRNTAGDDAVRVYTDFTCGTELSSEDLITSTAAIYTQYYETGSSSYVYLGVTENDSVNKFVSCINTTLAVPAAGSNSAYDLTKRVNGSVAPELTNVYIDVNQDAAEEVNTSIVATTPAATYNIYFNGSAAADISFYNHSNLELDSTGKGFTADVEVNVSRVVGEVHPSLETGGDDLITVYSDSGCSGGYELSSEVENPSDSTGQFDFIQYFEGSEGIYYLQANMTDGGQTYSTCGKAGFYVNSSNENVTDLTSQVSGVVPNVTSAFTNQHIISVGADINDDGADDYLTQTVDAVDQYYLFVDNRSGDGVAHNITFYNDSAGSFVLLTRARSFSNISINVSVVYGGANTYLENGTDTLRICDDIPARADFLNGVCTEVSNLTINPGVNAYGSNDYEIFFEQEAADTDYYLFTGDNESGTFYYSIKNFTSGLGGGNETEVNLTGRKWGVMHELYDNSTAIPNVTINMYESNGITFNARTYSLTDGTYRLYVHGANNTLKDIVYSKDAYISETRDDENITDGVGKQNNQTLATGVKIIVQEFDGNKVVVTNATVSLYTCSGSTANTCSGTYATCTHPSGDCVITGDNSIARGQDGTYNFAGITNGTYIQVKIEMEGYVTIMDPKIANHSTYQINEVYVQPAGLATNYTYFLRSAVPSCTLNARIVNGRDYARTGDTVDFTLDCSNRTGLNATLDATSLNASVSWLSMSDQGDGTYTYTVGVSETSDGLKTITGKATDGTNEAITHAYVTLDNTAPTVGTPQLSDSTVAPKDAVTVTANVSDTTAGVQDGSLCSVTVGGLRAETLSYNSTTGNCTGTISVPAQLDDGAQTLIVSIADRAGNTGTSNTTVTIMTASITVSLTYGTYGDTVNVTGGGFGYNENVTIDFGSTSNIQLTSSNTSGNISTQFTVDIQPAGDKDVTATGLTSGKIAQTTFTINGTANISLTPSMGPTGSTVYVFGRGFGANEQITLEVPAATTPVTLTSDAAGAFSTTFIANADATVNASGGTTGETDSAAFTLTTQTLTVSPSFGAYSTAVTVTGANFVAGENVRVDFGSTPGIVNGTVNSSQGFELTFSVDVQPAGVKQVYAEGAYGSKAAVAFTINNTANISLTPSMGPTGSTVYVFGRGFGANEQITLEVPAATTPVTLTSDAAGAFSTTFIANADATVNATGGTTAETDSVAFTLTTQTLTVSPSFGAYSTAVTVTGANFVAGENVRVDFGSTPGIVNGTVNSSQGFELTFSVDVQPAGVKQVYAEGAYGSKAAAAFTINGTANISLTPFTGPVGTRVDVDGRGFGANEVVTLQVPAATTPVTLTSDVAGSFSTSFIANADGTVNASGGTTGETDSAAFTISATIPVNLSISINSGVTYTTTASVTLTLHAEGSVSECKYSNNGSVWTDWENYGTSRAWNLTSGDGWKNVCYRCRSAAREESVIASADIILDTTRPAAPAPTSPANGTSINSAPVITWSASTDANGIATYTLELDNNSDFSTSLTKAGLTNTAYTLMTAEFDALDETTYYWRIRAIDNAGLVSVNSTIYNLIKDTVAPTFTNTTAASFNSKSVLITGTTDEAATCRFHTADVAYSAMSYSLGNLDVTSFAANYVADEGANTLYVRCKDTAGNAAASSTTVAFTVDSVAPVVIDSTPYGNYTAATLAAAAGGNGIAIKTDTVAVCRWDTNDESFANMDGNGGATFTTAADTWKTLPNATAAEGFNVYCIRCADDVGGTNAMTHSSYIMFTYLDSTAPGAPTGLTATQVGETRQVNLTWTAPTTNAEDIQGYNIYRSNNSAVTSASELVGCTGANVTRFSNIVPADGTYNYTVTAFDEVPNEGAAATSVGVTVTTSDSTAPTAPAGLSVVQVGETKQVNLTWTAPSGGADDGDIQGYNIYRSNNSAVTTSSNLVGCTGANVTRWTDLVPTDGTWNYTVTAFDEVPNEGAAATSVGVTVTTEDTTAPDSPATVTATQVGITREINLTWSASTASDLWGYFIYRQLNGGVSTSSSFIATVGGNLTQYTDIVPSDGTWNYTVIAVDTSWNKGTMAASGAVTVDATPPTIIASSPSGHDVTDNTPTLNITLKGMETGATCKFNNGSAFNFIGGEGTPMTDNNDGTYTHTFPTSIGSDGTYSYYIICNDSAGSTMTTPYPMSFYLNTQGNFNYTQDLTKNWNALWLPTDTVMINNWTSLGGNYTASNVLSSIDGNYRMVYYYNGTTWNSYVPARPVNTLTQMDNLNDRPYWVDMTAADRFEII